MQLPRKFPAPEHRQPFVDAKLTRPPGIAYTIRGTCYHIHNSAINLQRITSRPCSLLTLADDSYPTSLDLGGVMELFRKSGLHRHVGAKATT